MHLTKQSSCAKIKINNKFAYVVQKRKKNGLYSLQKKKTEIIYDVFRNIFFLCSFCYDNNHTCINNKI